MDQLGPGMRAIREQQKDGQVGIARRAFPHASKKKIKQLAGYISKIETEQERNPRLATFEWIARGCDWSVPRLFAEITGERNQGLPSMPQESQDPPIVTDEVGPHGSLLPSAVVLTDKQFEELVRLLRREATVVAGDRQTPSARAHKSVRGRPRPKSS